MTVEELEELRAGRLFVAQADLAGYPDTLPSLLARNVPLPACRRPRDVWRVPRSGGCVAGGGTAVEERVKLELGRLQGGQSLTCVEAELPTSKLLLVLFVPFLALVVVAAAGLSDRFTALHAQEQYGDLSGPLRSLDQASRALQNESVVSSWYVASGGAPKAELEKARAVTDATVKEFRLNEQAFATVGLRGTTHYAVSVVDPDARTRPLVRYGHPPGTSPATRGREPRGALLPPAPSSYRMTSATGTGCPCPPPGALHHYIVEVWALKSPVPAQKADAELFHSLIQRPPRRARSPSPTSVEARVPPHCTAPAGQIALEVHTAPSERMYRTVPNIPGRRNPSFGRALHETCSVPPARAGWGPIPGSPAKA